MNYISQNNGMYMQGYIREEFLQVIYVFLFYYYYYGALDYLCSV